MIYNLINAEGEIVSRIVVSDDPELNKNKAHNDAERARYAKEMQAYETEIAQWEAQCEALKAEAKAKREKEIEALEKKADKLIDDGKPRDAMKIAMRAEQLRVRALRIAYPPEPKRPNDPVFKSPEPFTLPDGYQLERADEA